MSPKRHRYRESQKAAARLAQTETHEATNPSPAQRYQAFKATQQSPELYEFQALFDFPLDDF
ncbi:hypothetical protein NL403_26275, partial [Klebsiella pneumoniae]|nr:hypothetical protein [Klebsiella pneumoniae]